MSAPEFTSGPTISGEATVGQTLAVDASGTDVWSWAYLWSTGDTGGSINLTTDDVGALITCQVTIANEDSETTTGVTPAVGPVTGSDPPDPPDPGLPNPLACTVADVAAWIRARTKDSNGIEVGTFNEDTRPTAAQAQEAIDHQVVLLHSKVGVIGPGCSGLAQGVVAIGAAAEIELSYFPEQARTDRSPYTYLIQRYQDALQGLYDCVAGNLPDTPDPDDPDAQNVRYGTLDCVSGTVAAYYTGRTWPAVPIPKPVPPPEVPEEVTDASQ